MTSSRPRFFMSDLTLDVTRPSSETVRERIELSDPDLGEPARWGSVFHLKEGVGDVDVAILDTPEGQLEVAVCKSCGGRSETLLDRRIVHEAFALPGRVMDELFDRHVIASADVTKMWILYDHKCLPEDSSSTTSTMASVIAAGLRVANEGLKTQSKQGVLVALCADGTTLQVALPTLSCELETVGSPVALDLSAYIDVRTLARPLLSYYAYGMREFVRSRQLKIVGACLAVSNTIAPARHSGPRNPVSLIASDGQRVLQIVDYTTTFTRERESEPFRELSSPLAGLIGLHIMPYADWREELQEWEEQNDTDDDDSLSPQPG